MFSLTVPLIFIQNLRSSVHDIYLLPLSYLRILIEKFEFENICEFAYTLLAVVLFQILGVFFNPLFKYMIYFGHLIIGNTISRFF